MNPIAETAAPWGVAEFAQFGFAGLMCGALLWVLVFLYRSHRDERKEWKSDLFQFMDKSDQKTDKLTDVVGELTNVVRDLKR